MLTPGLDTTALERHMVNALWADAAARLGLSCRYLTPQVLIIDGPAGPIMRMCGVYHDLDGFAAGVICGDKTLARRALAEAGLPIPRGATFQWNDVAGAGAFAQSLAAACVAKPARNTSSSVGVSVGLLTPTQVANGFRRAALYSEEVLIEEYVRGDDYRLLVYDGRCLSVIRRERPHVVGNGHDSVRTLIRRENERRTVSLAWKPGDPPLMPLKADARARRHLRSQELTLDSVPEAARVVLLSPLANYGIGASYRECIQHTHPAIINGAEMAARAAGVVLAGIDVIAPDIAAPMFTINEINTTPSTELHYFVSNPDAATDPFTAILQARASSLTRPSATPGVRDAEGTPGMAPGHPRPTAPAA